MERERIELLQQLFENVNLWLHLVEAKNAGLVAFNVALVAAVSGFDMLAQYKVLLSGIVFGLLIPSVICLYSFKPINKSLKKTDGIGIDANLLHYAYVASLNEDEFLSKLYDLYWGEADKDVTIIPQIEKDYAQEIIQNSRITILKQFYFRKALYANIAIICAIVLLVIYA